MSKKLDWVQTNEAGPQDVLLQLKLLGSEHTRLLTRVQDLNLSGLIQSISKRKYSVTARARRVSGSRDKKRATDVLSQHFT